MSYAWGMESINSMLPLPDCYYYCHECYGSVFTRALTNRRLGDPQPFPRIIEIKSTTKRKRECRAFALFDNEGACVVQSLPIYSNFLCHTKLLYAYAWIYHCHNEIFYQFSIISLLLWLVMISPLALSFFGNAYLCNVWNFTSNQWCAYTQEPKQTHHSRACKHKKASPEKTFNVCIYGFFVFTKNNRNSVFAEVTVLTMTVTEWWWYRKSSTPPPMHTSQRFLLQLKTLETSRPSISYLLWASSTFRDARNVLSKTKYSMFWVGE